MIKFTPRLFSELLADGMAEKWPVHYSQLSDKVFPLEPDYKKYNTLQDLGMLWCLGVYDDEKLIGYAVFIVSTHLHYASAKHAMEDLYWIDEEYRKGFTGVRLFKEIENGLKQIGVQKIILGTKTKADVGRIFERLGYKQFECLYGKAI